VVSVTYGIPGTQSIENSQFQRKSYCRGIFRSVNFTAFEVRETKERFWFSTDLCAKVKVISKSRLVMWLIGHQRIGDSDN